MAWLLPEATAPVLSRFVACFRLMMSARTKRWAWDNLKPMLHQRPRLKTGAAEPKDKRKRLARRVFRPTNHGLRSYAPRLFRAHLLVRPPRPKGLGYDLLPLRGTNLWP
jgi:hypothetical protein